MSKFKNLTARLLTTFFIFSLTSINVQATSTQPNKENIKNEKEVIDITKIQGSEIKYGASIKLFDEEKGDEVFYKIVSEYEADVSKGLISISSPLAKALIGKKVNESLEFKTPKGVKYYQIKSVDYI